MNKLKCECCGGIVNPSTYRCEYCGTQYEGNNYQTLRIESFTSPCQVLKSQMVIPTDAINSYGSETMAKIASEKLIKNLADALAPYTEMETEFDPVNMRQIVTARIRVLEPNYRF